MKRVRTYPLNATLLARTTATDDGGTRIEIKRHRSSVARRTPTEWVTICQINPQGWVTESVTWEYADAYLSRAAPGYAAIVADLRTFPDFTITSTYPFTPPPAEPHHAPSATVIHLDSARRQRRGAQA